MEVQSRLAVVNHGKLKQDTRLPAEENELDRLYTEAKEIAKIQEEAANRAKQEPKTVTIWDAEGGPIEVPEGFGEIAICFGHDENGKPLYMIKKA